MKYCKLRDERGMKDSDVARETGITKSTFSDWKNGNRTVPIPDKIWPFVAEYVASLRQKGKYIFLRCKTGRQ